MITGSITLKCRNIWTTDFFGCKWRRFYLNYSSPADPSLREREDVTVVQVGTTGIKFNLIRTLEAYYTTRDMQGLYGASLSERALNSLTSWADIKRMTEVRSEKQLVRVMSERFSPGVCQSQLSLSWNNSIVSCYEVFSDVLGGVLMGSKWCPPALSGCFRVTMSCCVRSSLELSRGLQQPDSSLCRFTCPSAWRRFTVCVSSSFCCFAYPRSSNSLARCRVSCYQAQNLLMRPLQYNREWLYNVYSGEWVTYVPYIYVCIYTRATVLLVYVGLAQARPNNMLKDWFQECICERVTLICKCLVLLNDSLKMIPTLCSTPDGSSIAAFSYNTFHCSIRWGSYPSVSNPTWCTDSAILSKMDKRQHHHSQFNWLTEWSVRAWQS